MGKMSAELLERRRAKIKEMTDAMNGKTLPEIICEVIYSDEADNVKVEAMLAVVTNSHISLLDRMFDGDVDKINAALKKIPESD